VDVRQTSRRLSYVLRHRPDSLGLVLDPAGCLDVEDLLAALAASGRPVSREQLEHVVATNDKQRFAFDASRTRLRASQGHSVPVELGYAPAPPPDVLFHGTPLRTVAVVLREGLRSQGRHAVHLSADVSTAAAVGRRRGSFAVLRVDAAAMAAAGAVFTRSANGVWLVDAVPAQHLTVED
jgi:putative RNA 2'-phosphotransferase